MGLGTLTMLTMLWAPGQALPADVVPFNQAKMEIPIRYDPAKKATIRELLLFVSRNQGDSWEQYTAASPDRDQFFLFTAPSDGIYWFQIVIVDKQGKRDPMDPSKAAGPPLKVLIDTKAPVIAIKSLERTADEATVSWDIQEANPDWSKFSLEYRAGEGSWMPVEGSRMANDGRGVPYGSARFRVSQPGPLTVRIQAFDTAGNRAEATKDAAAPAQVAAAPTKETTTQSMRMPSDVPPPTNVGSSDPLNSSMTLPSLDSTPSLATRTPEPVRSPIQEKPPVTPPVSSDPVRTTDVGSPLAVSPYASHTSNGQPLPTPQIINVARFDLAYDVDSKGPSGVSKAEVWVTRDDGKAWQKWSVTEKTDSPITVDLAKRDNPQLEGLYGLKIVLLSGAGLSKGPPVSGEAPDMRVDLDVTPPVVKIYEPIPDPSQRDTMVLRWQAVDRNLASDPITLEWSEQQDGPWNPIVGSDGNSVGTSGNTAKRLANSGQYAWRLPTNFPTHRVYLRVTARDVAGNVAEARTPHPILVDMNKPVARIQGIIGAAAPERR